MSAVNPASVVNPNGLMHIPPPSAIGPGAILPSGAQNASLSVGPGFGHNAYRPNEHYGKYSPRLLSQCPTNFGSGRGRAHGGHAGYDDGYYPFAHQLPPFASQGGYQMPQWGHGQQVPADMMYGRYGYPNVTASGSPMNYGAYYPPATYAASPAFNTASSGPSFRGGYPATTAATSGYAPAYAGVSTAGPSYGQYLTSGVSAPMPYSTAPAYNPYATTGYGATINYSTAPSYGAPYTSGGGNFSAFSTAGGYGSGFTATSGAASSAPYDPAFLAAMQALSFGK